jgi:hypothetical protein
MRLPRLNPNSGKRARQVQIELVGIGELAAVVTGLAVVAEI